MKSLKLLQANTDHLLAAMITSGGMVKISHDAELAFAAAVADKYGVHFTDTMAIILVTGLITGENKYEELDEHDPESLVKLYMAHDDKYKIETERNGRDYGMEFLAESNEVTFDDLEDDDWLEAGELDTPSEDPDREREEFLDILDTLG